MKIYYDKTLIVHEKEGYYYFYSPELGFWFKGDITAHLVIEYILSHQGDIDTHTLQTYLKSHGVCESIQTITEWIENLYKTRLFFPSQKTYEAAVDTFRESYVIPKDQRLEMVYLHTTHRCNFNCTYCYNKDISRNKSDELSTDQWKKIVDTLTQYGVSHYIFTGGEPLMRDDLSDIISRVRIRGSNSYSVDLLTNGSLLTEEKIETFAPLVDTFIISIDSTDMAIHGKHRGEKGFQTLMGAITYLSEHFPKKIRTRTVLTRDNVHDTIETARILRTQYGVSSHEIALRLPNSQEEIPLTPDISVVEEIKKESEDLEHRDFTLPGRVKCGASTSILGVDMRGDMYPCQTLLEEEEFRIGSLLDEDWHEQLLNSPVREQFRTLTVDTRDVHRGCEYRYLCGGGCPAIAWNLYRDLKAYVPFLHEYNRDFAKRLMFLSTVRKVR
ncbi:MAG: radical SAM protein [Theionarchaea archaeon]|nr:radical SAM protein [Theionarchaea archaeon]